MSPEPSRSLAIKKISEIIKDIHIAMPPLATLSLL